MCVFPGQEAPPRSTRNAVDFCGSAREKLALNILYALSPCLLHMNCTYFGLIICSPRDMLHFPPMVARMDYLKAT